MGMVLCDRLEELWLEIDRQHLGYLQSEERRGEQRAKLEGYMIEFLCLAPHDRKFNCPQTAEVLHRSAITQEKFSGQRASRAWAAVAKYADNLILQPWRKEFRELKLYCGFYKHEVDECLVGAEQMFEAMGYRHMGNATMHLPGIIDPDRITSVSKDAIMAELECDIMQKIWDAMVQHRSPISWADVLTFRENYPGTAEKAVRALMHRVQERLYQQQHNQRPRANCYGNYYDEHPTLYPSPQPQPYQRVTHVVSPHQNLPLSSYQSHYQQPPFTLKPQDLYPSNGYQVHPPYNAPLLANGYGHQHPPMYPTTVPTAQLIELEPSPVHHAVHPHHYYPLPDPPRTIELPSSRAKDDGAGSWENWDSVFKNSQSYHKESKWEMVNVMPHPVESQLSEHMRGMYLAQSTTPPRRSETKARTEGDGASRHRLSKTSIELEDVVSKHRLSKSSLESEVDAAKNRKTKPSAESDYKVSKALLGSGDGMTSVAEKDTKNVPYTKNGQLLSDREFTSRVREPSPEPPRPPFHPAPLPNVVTLDVSPSFVRETSPVVELPPENQWECVACTFHNSERKNVCEMCGKSRGRGEISPQQCGRKCPNCTLVNQPRRNFCEACNQSLKDSLTYI